MEAIRLDMRQFCAKVKQLPERVCRNMFAETPGEKYIYDIAVKAALEERNILFGSIDFEQFDEDDIVNFIDTCFSDYCKEIKNSEKILQQMGQSSVLTSDKQKYF